MAPAAISAVVEAVRRGEPWRRALETVALAAGAEGAIESIATEAVGNWVWLTSFDRHEAALDVRGVVSSMAPALSCHFRVVHHVEPSALLAAFAACRFAQDGLANVVVARASPDSLPYPDESFDCVTWHGPATRSADSTRAGVSRVVAECRRVLRPAGCMYVAFDNPVWYGRFANGGLRRSDDRAVVAAVRVAGFRHVERFYAFPTFDRPSALVPGTRRAWRAREAMEPSGSLRAIARRGAAFVGLYAVLAPSVVLVARK